MSCNRKIKVFSYIICFLFFSHLGNSQIDTMSVSISDSSNTLQLYKILKTDGGELIGEIIKQDSRELFFRTNDGREFYIPQHTIKEIVKLNPKDFNRKGDFIGEEPFATRYFISTNGLPIKKGESYVLWNWYGPDVQFGLGNNFGVGIITSWIGAPVIGTIKKSWQINNYTQFAIGGLLGSGSWGMPGIGGALPFATLSFGDRNRNLAFSGGYGIVVNDGDSETGFLTSLAAMTKVSRKVSLVCETFFVIPTSNNIEPAVLLLPGLRLHQSKGKAVQFGISGVFIDGESISIPMFQWYREF